MTRLTRQMIIKQMFDNGSIQTPILTKYFKRVFVGYVMKEGIDKANRKLKEV